tara:strand:- start:23888 stop:24454 length:567 start_codon:yes stop_codon:yes gene_type:complete
VPRTGVYLIDLSSSVRINNQITASEVRVVDETGANIGVFPTKEALKMAEDKDTDLVEVSAKAKPPIAKLIDYGKYQYAEKKKAKTAKGSHKTETKTLQVKIGTGEHDLELKSKKASAFLKEGHRVKIDLFLGGRAKYLNQDFLKTRLDRILTLITEEHKVADGPKKSPKGLTVILERGKAKQNENESQ